MIKHKNVTKRTFYVLLFVLSATCSDGNQLCTNFVKKACSGKDIPWCNSLPITNDMHTSQKDVNFKREILRMHNLFRQRPVKGHYAADMLQLTWNKELEAAALSTALNSCAKKDLTTDCFETPSFIGIDGLLVSLNSNQNLTLAQLMEHVNATWEKEERSVTPSMISALDKNEARNMPNWIRVKAAASSRIGCAYVIKNGANEQSGCLSCKQDFAQFAIKEKIFEMGEPASKCPKGAKRSSRYKGLCAMPRHRTRKYIYREITSPLLRDCTEQIKQKCKDKPTACMDDTCPQAILDSRSDPFFATDIVNLHNEYRSKKIYGHEAADMHMLKWNKNLADLALKWLLVLCKTDQFEHDKCRGTERYDPIGQNLYDAATLLEPSTIVSSGLAAWYDEYKLMGETILFPFKSGKHVDKVGHFTQLVWANTTSVGCAYLMVSSGNNQRSILACNYYPAGNIVAENAFIKGKPLSKCPRTSKRSAQFPLLCT